MAIVTMECKWELICDLSNGAISNEPRTNPNPVFKVTPFFNAKYLTNGYRYGHSYIYYRRRIANTSFRMASLSMILSDL